MLSATPRFLVSGRARPRRALLILPPKAYAKACRVVHARTRAFARQAVPRLVLDYRATAAAPRAFQLARHATRATAAALGAVMLLRHRRDCAVPAVPRHDDSK